MVPLPALVLLALLALAPSARATFPGANGRIAFVEGTGFDLFTMDPDGSNRTLVVHGAFHPKWSPDGTKLAYSNGGQVFVANADGSGPVALHISQGSAAINEAWSPVGNELAQVEEIFNAGNPPDLVITRQGYPPGSPAGPGLGVAGDNPDWSPDGSLIAFEGQDTGAIYKTPPGGGGSTTFRFGGNPSWSPDASKIAFVDSGGIWVANSADASSATKLFTPTGPNELASQPVWSPDGSKIAFTRTVVHPNGTPTCDINVMNADGSAVTPITSGTDCAATPDWQPIPINTYPRPRGATPMRIPLVPANKQCTAPNSTHGAPLAFGSCAPPQLTSSQLTTGVPDSNGLPVRMTASMLLRAVSGDVRIDADINDVLKKDLTDYSGSLRAELPVRITDKNNTPSPGRPGAGTTVPFQYGFDIPCVPDPAPTIGSDCAISTTANTLVPGTMSASLRTIWQIGRARVDDPGPDGNPDTTADNSPFVVQGLFVP